MNGKGVYPGCSKSNIDRSMQVEISIQCSSTSSFFNSTTCKTMNYVYNILNNEYDGNGQIQIGKGIFNFNKTINNHNKQIIISGYGINETILNFNNNNFIKCNWTECYISSIDLQFPSLNISNILTRGFLIASDRYALAAQKNIGASV